MFKIFEGLPQNNVLSKNKDPSYPNFTSQLAGKTKFPRTKKSAALFPCLRADRLLKCSEKIHFQEALFLEMKT